MGLPIPVIAACGIQSFSELALHELSNSKARVGVYWRLPIAKLMTSHNGNQIMKALTKKQTLTSSNEFDARYQEVLARNKDFDGKFYYSVKTTGVYCRPSCAARPARPENIAFYESCEGAELAGFRACKRCRPDKKALAEMHIDTVSNACKFIENCETLPSLKDLAERAGMSIYHFHRTFKLVTGLTPKAYGSAKRAERVRTELEQNESVTGAIYNAGFSSSGRFYEKSNAFLGMTPKNFRAGGANTEINFAIAECSLGSILVATSSRGICAIFLGDDPNQLAQELQDKFSNANLIAADEQYDRLVAQVIGFIEAPSIGLDLPLDVRGTAFQQRVWQALRNIPVGATTTYAEIAKQIGSPSAFRAVANACGANSIAVAIPCHRVIRNDGAVSGYRWGVDRKRTLLLKEGGQ
jgi:AraC family transcriptional regulator, regulatory protein of adaptative response / methylated-DNA-[protein]-cysteine methyltransferase